MAFPPKHRNTEAPKHRQKQQTSPELQADLLQFLRQKFYPADPKAFYQDRRLLLQWVVLWPARWLDSRGVSISTAEYKRIFVEDIFLEAVRFGQTNSIKYRPAWLAKCLQSHFAMHGDEIYQAAKSMRALAENAVLVAGQALHQPAPDPVREMAAAARLLRAKKNVPKPPQKDQLNLF